MTQMNLSSANASGLSRSVSPMPRPTPDSPASVAAASTASAAPSPRQAAGAMAPVSLASSSGAVPHFEKRSVPAPEISGIRELADKTNADARSPHAVIKELCQARDYFRNLRAKGKQTSNDRLFYPDGSRTDKLIKPILNTENARNPGLNAVGFQNEEKMVEFLRVLSSPIRDGQEGHIRCHVGMSRDSHRIAVDAFKHQEGGFTLVAVDSAWILEVRERLQALERKHPDIIKGNLIVPTLNQLHSEGCRIFAVHSLNALHDFQPYIQSLHRQIYDHFRGKSAPRPLGSGWERGKGNTISLGSALAAFKVLPPKFFKHMQVKRPKPGQAYTEHDVAESYNPALKDQPVNKKGQTLRERFASQNPDKDPADFSRADRTASLDDKRLVLIDRAIAHYERKYGISLDAKPPGRRFWLGNDWY